jgi:hypothetical protein
MPSLIGYPDWLSPDPIARQWWTMPPKPDAAAALGEKFLAVLDAQRALGEGSYPLLLQRLIELADPQASPELIEKALGKKAFKDRVVVAQKKNRAAPVALSEDLRRLAASPLLLEFVLEQLCTPANPTWPPSKLKAKVESKLKKPFEEAVQRQVRDQTLPPAVGSRLEKNKPVLYLRRIPPAPPSPPPEEVLADKLLQVLQAQRVLGGEAYPLPMERLVELTSPGAAAALVKKALAHPVLKDQLALFDAKKPKAPVALIEDRDRLVSSHTLLEFLLKDKRKAKEQAFPIESLLPKRSDFCQPFEVAVRRQIETDSLPPSIGWMWISKKQHVFFLEDVHRGRSATGRVAVGETTPLPVPPSPQVASADFARVFDEAFNQINRRKGGHNFVSLVDLRREVPLARAVFDSELRKLRVAGRYTLSAAEGRHGITPQEREAAITEDGSLLLYVSSRNAP